MKKVGIMSMQRIFNYGSYLQAFALSNMIKELGHTVEFVDFKIESCAVTPAKRLESSDLPEEYQEHFEKIVAYENKFTYEFLPELGVTIRNERPELDTLVIGSDEVFNCLQDNSDVGCSLELFGKNHQAKRIISYAASCGSTTLEKIEKFEDIRMEVSQHLNKFDKISVRDLNSKQFVEGLSSIQPEMHLDPVLVYDFKNAVKKIDNNLKDYIIVYAYPFNLTDEECNDIRKFAKKHHKKIVTIGTYQRCTDIFVLAHPLEVLPIFEKADFVITNTFHGTIFSIKSHTPFVSFMRNYNSEKLSDLLNKLKIENRRISSLQELDDKFDETIDFHSIDKLLEKERMRSMVYLKNNI